MLRKTLTALVGIGLVAAAPGLRAQEAASPTSAAAARAVSPDPVLDELVAEALRNNPDVVGAERSAEAAQQKIRPAGTLPDPFLSLNYQNDGWSPSLGESDMTWLAPVFSQPLPWPGKLRLAGKIAEDQAREIEHEVAGRARLAVEARVRRFYYDWSLSNRLLTLLEERVATWRQIEVVVRERYATGLAVQQDLLRAQAEVLKLDEERADEEARLRSRAAELNRAVGRPQDAALEGKGSLPEATETAPLEALQESARNRSPELAALNARLEADGDRVALAKKNFLPDFVASGGPMYRGGLDPMWQVGLGVTLPVFSGSRQKPLEKEAQLLRSSDEELLKATRSELDLRARERFEALQASEKVARLYREGILSVDQLSFDAALASYKTGKVPFVTVLDALSTFYADRAAYLSRLADAAKLRVAIDEAGLGANPMR
jgi:outer membrane protein TolC